MVNIIEKIELYLKIIALFIKKALKELSMNRNNMVLFVIAFLLNTGGNIYFLLIVFRQQSFIAGWGFYNMLILFSTYRVINGFINLFLKKNIENMLRVIRRGDLDLMLIRPVSSWFLLNFSQISATRIADIVTGTVLIIYSLFFVHWTFASLFLYMLTAFIGLILISCFYILISFTAFLNVKESVLDFFDKIIRSSSRVPLSMANDTIQFITFWIIPLMFLSTIPSEILEDRIPHVPLILLSSCLLVFLYILLTHTLWLLCIKKYSSASS